MLSEVKKKEKGNMTREEILLATQIIIDSHTAKDAAEIIAFLYANHPILMIKDKSVVHRDSKKDISLLYK